MNPSRLFVRVYLATVLAFAVLFGLGMLYSRVVWGDRQRSTELWTRQYFLELQRNRGDPVALQKSLEWMRQISMLQLSLYDLDCRLVGSTQNGAPDTLEPESCARAQAEGTFQLSQSKFVESISVDGKLVGVGLVLFRPAEASRTATVVGMSLLVLMGLALVFARHLVKPLQRIGDAATRFGRGELSARSGVSRGDEIGDVARAFDQTADRVTRLMTAQRELMANVSHELRTPLARIRVAIDLVADGVTKEAVEVLPEISSDLLELERLLEDVMTVARLDLAQADGVQPRMPLRKERTEPGALVEKAATRFRAQHPGRTLDVQVGQQLATIDVDAMLVRRAIENLIDNADKYSEPETPISVDVSPTGTGIALTVRDQGIGIEKADLERIFTPFFRTDRSRSRATGGVGLGLVLARRVVEAHGGQIHIDSEVGKGTAVRFELPSATA